MAPSMEPVIVYLTPELKRYLEHQAKAHERTLSAECRFILRTVCVDAEGNLPDG